MTFDERVVLHREARAFQRDALLVRTGSWTGPARVKRVPRVLREQVEEVA